jgi:hypothetical protein
VTAHRCSPAPTDAALELQVAEVVMSAPMSLALTWHTAHGLRLLFDRACALEDWMHAHRLCLSCGRPLETARVVAA